MTTLRDCIWVWGNRETRGDAAAGLSAYAQASPAARAQMLGLRNIVIAGGEVLQPAAACALAQECAALGGRLVYEICPGAMTGSASDYAQDGQAALAAAALVPSLEAVLLDDLTSQQIEARRMPPTELAKICQSLRRESRPLEVWGVVYTMNLDHPGLDEYLRYLDVINLWTWRAQDLRDLEANLVRCEALAPQKPIVLGAYMYDYGEAKPMPLDLMEQQCQAGLEWLKEGRIAGLVLLSITNEPRALDWTRAWIPRAVG